MKLFSKGKSAARAAAAPTPAFQPMDRAHLLGLLEQIVSGGQSGVLSLRDAKGEWTYAFQGGGLVHASGGRIRGARQAFDLLWEFDNGEILFTPDSDAALTSNLYIDKGRLLELLRRSQSVLQGPGSPILPAAQQGPAFPATPTGTAPGTPPPYAAGGFPPPAWAVPSQTQNYPAGDSPPPQLPQPASAAPPVIPPVALPVPPQASLPVISPPAPSPPATAKRPLTPGAAPGQAAAAPSFSVPPMPIPKRREAAPVSPAQSPAPVAPPPVAKPVPGAQPADAGKPGTPQDDLKVLRASLIAQAPQAQPREAGGAWKIKQTDGTMAAPMAPDTRKVVKPAKPKRPSRLNALVQENAIRFLLWACERHYSPDDHWTVKDAFEVATLELRDQFLGAFSQAFKTRARTAGTEEDDIDQVTAGRMRGRARPRKR